MTPRVAEQNASLTPTNKTIILAGATGNLGRRIAQNLIHRGATVKALVRRGSTSQEVNSLRQQGALVVEVDFSNTAELTGACAGASCVISALSGLRDVIVEAQTRLLHAALEAGVPRFIPSDFCIDFTRLPKGTNRNLDLRREFSERLDQAPIAATSILNGMFTNLLTGQAPVILFGLKRVIYWGEARQLMDFTTLQDTAVFTAAAALDPTTPRFLRIAGDVQAMQGLKEAASEATGKPFHLFRIGGLGVLKTMIKLARTLFPAKNDVFPPWQGMQYLYDMLSGLPKLESLDNDRYPNIRWTSVREVLATRLS